MRLKLLRLFAILLVVSILLAAVDGGRDNNRRRRKRQHRRKALTKQDEIGYNKNRNHGDKRHSPSSIGEDENLNNDNNNNNNKNNNNPADFIWAKHNVAAGDTAVLHCSFDAMYPTYFVHRVIDWTKESQSINDGELERIKMSDGKLFDSNKKLLAKGDQMIFDNNKRYRVFTPSGTALSVLIIRRAKKSDSGLYKCNLSDSGHRQKYLLLNVSDSSIEAQTSPDEVKGYVGENVTLWCNATGYPRPMVYWTKEDLRSKLPDGSYQHWGNSLQVSRTKKSDEGSYLCFVDNFVQPIMSYVFKLKVYDKFTSKLSAEMFRYDSPRLYKGSEMAFAPAPIKDRAYMLTCKLSLKDYQHNNNIRVVWYRKGRRIKQFSRRFLIIKYIKTSAPFRAETTLIIRKFNKIDNGQYMCQIRSDFKKASFVFNMDKPPIGDPRSAPKSPTNDNRSTTAQPTDDDEEDNGDDYDSDDGDDEDLSIQSESSGSSRKGGKKRGRN